jgi:FkbM family methyltransferase
MNGYCTYEQWKRARWGINWHVILCGVFGSQWSWPGRLRCFVEVGIGPLDISALPYVVDKGLQVIGIDPNPACVEAARTAFPLADIRQRAVWHTSGDKVQLTNNQGSSGIVGQWKPSEGGRGTFEAETMRFDEIDTGQIDAINIDCEGCEHIVLEQMASRPQVIGIELWPQYPKAQWCEDWLLREGYRPIFSTGPMSETHIFAKLD